MTTIRYVLRDGSVRTVDASDGESLMRVAVFNGISDIVGECGGELSCATCHVYVPSDVQELLPPPSADEADLLESTMGDYRSCSRLGCQIIVSDGLADAEIVIAPAP
ncbi:2Fe-2S iron-sulfur cluster-binding protein [Microbacterium sp. NPDC055357]